MFMIYDNENTLEINSDDDIENLGPNNNFDLDTDNLYEYVYDPSNDDLQNEEYPRKIQDWAKDLLARNNDAIGWIRIPGFVDENGKEYINYPVFQHSDNDYYLTHDIDGNYYMSGSIYVDYRETIDEYGQPDNIVIYGHHMRNLGTAFTHLAEYKSGINMLEKYPIIEFNTIYEKNQEYAIVSVYVAAINEWQDPDLFPYWLYYNFDKSNNKNDDNESSQIDSTTESNNDVSTSNSTDDSNKYENRPDAGDLNTDYNYDDFDIWKERTLAHSWYESDIDCTIDDSYITLSTCSNETPYMRLVITAKKLDRNDNRKEILSSYKDKNDTDIYFPPVWINWWGQHRKYLGWNY